MNRKAEKGRGPYFIPLCHYHNHFHARSRTFRYLFSTLHVRWLSHIFNRTTCIYQTATWRDLPPYWITIWLIDDVKLVCLRDDLILAFLLQQFEMRHRWIRTRIDYHPCITSELTKCANHPSQTVPIAKRYCASKKDLRMATDLT